MSCRWGITDGISPSTGPWHKAMLEHISVRVEINPNRNLYILQKQGSLSCQSYHMTMSQLSFMLTIWGT